MELFGQILFLTMVSLLCAVVYFAPILIASARRVTGIGAVVVINVFLGWTLLGWVAALAMAIGMKREEDVK
jgi:hypothetical protein